MADALYDIGVRVSADFSGFSGPVASGLRTLMDFQQRLQSVDTAASRLAPQLRTYYSTMEQAAQRTGLAYDASQQSLNKLLGAGGLTAQNMQAHAAAMGELTTAQAALSAETSTYNGLMAEQRAAVDKAAASQRAMMGIMGGAAAFGVGLMGLGAIKGWVNDAQQMQDALTQLGAVAQGTSGQLDKLYSQSFSVASKTQFSAPQILDLEKIMAIHGFTDPTGKLTQRQVINQAIPYFAQAAEIEQRMKGVSFEDTAAALTQQAHMFGNYTGKALQNNVQLAVRAGLASGMSPDQQTQILRYVMPAVKGLGVSSLDAYAITALANQTGLTLNRGGSNLGAFFRYMTPGGSAAHQQGLAAIEQYGRGQFFDAAGTFEGFANAQRIIGTFMRNPAVSQAQRLTDLTNAFKVQGEQVAVALGTPTAQTQYGAIVKRLEPYDPIKNPTGYASLQDMQLKLNQTLVGQMNTLNTNMHSIGAMLGKELVPDLTKGAHAAVQFTDALMGFGKAHPFLVKTAADFGLLGTAAGLIGGPIVAAASAMTLLGGSTAGFAAALLPATGAVGALAAGLAVEAAFFADLGDIMNVVNGHMSHMTAAAKVLATALETVFAPVVAGIQAFDALEGFLNGGGHPSAYPTTRKPHAADVWRNGEWMRPEVVNGQRILLPDPAAAVGKQAERTVHVHMVQGAVQIVVPTHPGQDAHHVAALTAEAAKKALKDLSQGFGMDAHYGGYNFTSNPTLRSGGW